MQMNFRMFWQWENIITKEFFIITLAGIITLADNIILVVDYHKFSDHCTWGSNRVYITDKVDNQLQIDQMLK